MKLPGIILIVLGCLALAYQGIRYTTREKLIDIGSLKVTASEKKTLPLPPIVGGIALVAGIALVLPTGKRNSSPRILPFLRVPPATPGGVTVDHGKDVSLEL